MARLRRRTLKQEPGEPDVTPLGDAPWSKLHSEAEKVQIGPGASIEASRRVVMALRASEQSATDLGSRIWWLNLWLLVFTIAICALTVVLVLVELGVMRRPHEQVTGGAWVLWGYVLPNPTGISGHAAIGTYNTRTLCEEARRQPQSKLGNLPVTLTCLPDTIDPRGPKGK